MVIAGSVRPFHHPEVSSAWSGTGIAGQVERDMVVPQFWTIGHRIPGRNLALTYKAKIPRGIATRLKVRTGLSRSRTAKEGN